MGKNLKILYLEDDAYDYRLVCNTLKKDKLLADIQWVKTEDEYKEFLENQPFDVILADYKLPNYDGISALKYAKENYAEIPVIIVSGTLGEELAIDTIKDGATDYILKHRLKRLPPAIIRALNEAQERRKRIQAEENLKRSLIEKTVLLRELHHRVKNNMQIICSILGLQSGKIKNRELLSIFKEVEHRIRSIALTHEMFYNVEDFSSINFEYYAHRLISGLLVFFEILPHQIDYHIDVQNIYLGLDTALSCGLLLNELVANSFKHAFPENRQGKINIKLKKMDLGYELTVSDNGIGLPSELDWQTADTLGFILIVSLTKQLKGKLELDGTEGTKFTVQFNPKENKETEINFSQKNV